MTQADEDHARTLLLEAFTAGWQAALAVTISNPRVLAVVESCFDLWLVEAVDEIDVVGLPFRGRPDLPGPRHTDWPGSRASQRTEDHDLSAAGPRPLIPTQRLPSDDESLTGQAEPERRRGSVTRDPRRLLTRSVGRTSPKHRDVSPRAD